MSRRQGRLDLYAFLMVVVLGETLRDPTTDRPAWTTTYAVR